MAFTNTKSDLRFPFSRQPAHCMVLDLTSGFDGEIFQEVARGIANFFSIVCAMSTGPTRVPFFAMFAMTPYTEIVLSFQRIMKSSYSRVEAALADMQKLLTEGSVQTKDTLDTKSLEHSIRGATFQFQKIKQDVGSVSKLEVTIIMCHKQELMQSGIAEVLAKINLTDISHVCALSVVNESTVKLDVAYGSQEVTDSHKDDHGNENLMELNGILEVMRVDCDYLSIESIMRNWLGDKSIEREHLHVEFKTAREAKLLIKCDLRERLIDISEFAQRHCFEIGLEFGGLESNSQACKNAFKPGTPTPIIKLRVVKRVQLSSICESIVFGKPMLLSSSNCWQMEWDELETNQNYFNALCRLLVESKQALICENVTAIPCRRGTHQTEQPVGLFVLMASMNTDSLLLKSICCRELLLTSQVPLQPQWEVITKNAMDDIERALNFVESEPEFNPLLSQSRLTQSIKSSLQSHCGSGREALKKLSENRAGSKSAGLNSACRNATFQLANRKPATGKAARFVAPRQNEMHQAQNCNTIEESRAPKISFGVKQRQAKTVTFPDFTDF